MNRSAYPRRPYLPTTTAPMDGERAEQIDARFYAALQQIKASHQFTIDAHARRQGASVTELPLSVAGITGRVRG